MKFFKELFTTIKNAKKEYFYKLITSIVMRSTLLIIPLLFSYAITNVTNGNIEKAIILIIISMFTTLLYRIVEGLNQVTFYKLYCKLSDYYTSLVIDKTMDNSMFSLSRFTLGEYSNIALTDVDIISNFFSNLVTRFVQVIEFIIIFIYFYFIDIYIFIIAVILTIVMLFIAIKKGSVIQVLNNNRKNKLDNLTAGVHEYFQGIKEIKSFNFFPIMSKKTKDKSTEYLVAHSKYNVTFNAINYCILFAFEFFRLLSVIYGIYLTTIGKVEVGILLIIYNYYQKIIDNFSTILTINVEYRNLKVSLIRFNKILEYSNLKDNREPLNEVEGYIKFENILYGFRDNPILKNASFSIEKNSINVLLCSESKSNGIFDLLLRLNRQHEGTITLDNTNIQDISGYLKIISSARRSPYFFDMSIKDNLCMVNNDVNNMLAVCKKLGINDDILKLSKGYDTILNSNTPITDELKFLLEVARMLIKNSKVLLFDGSVNNLDMKSKSRLMKYLSELKINHTIVIASNDEFILNEADKVIEIRER